MTLLPPTLAAAQARMAAVQPAAVARTRNALGGAVSRLSPYITHGFVSLGDVLAGVNGQHPPDIRQACTGVPVIDQAVRTLCATGMLRNHARMFPSQRRHGDAATIAQALSGARSVRSFDEPHLDPWLTQWALCDAAPALFAQVERPCGSFSPWWNRVSRGLESAADLLATPRALAW